MNRTSIRQRFRLFAIAFVTVMQLPAVAWLCGRTHSMWPVLAAVVFSTPYLRGLQTPWQMETRPLSKLKRWRIVRVVRQGAQQALAGEGEGAIKSDPSATQS